jgi:hypothetical protein
MLQKMGGRKFALSLIGVGAICFLAVLGKDVAAFGSIALIVTAYSGANSYIEGRHATRGKSEP